MAETKIIHGARAQILIADPTAGSEKSKPVGVFTDVSYGVAYDVTPAFILGRFSAAELVYTGMDVVNISANGFRVLDNDAYVACQMPKLQDLLKGKEVSIEILDRQSGKKILSVVGVKVVSWNSGQSSRAISTFSVNFMGRIASTETNIGDDEASGASTITSGSGN